MSEFKWFRKSVAFCAILFIIGVFLVALQPLLLREVHVRILNNENNLDVKTIEGELADFQLQKWSTNTLERIRGKIMTLESLKDKIEESEDSIVCEKQNGHWWSWRCDALVTIKAKIFVPEVVDENKRPKNDVPPLEGPIEIANNNDASNQDKRLQETVELLTDILNSQAEDEKVDWSKDRTLMDKKADLILKVLYLADGIALNTIPSYAAPTNVEKSQQLIKKYSDTLGELEQLNVSQLGSEYAESYIQWYKLLTYTAPASRKIESLKDKLNDLVLRSQKWKAGTGSGADRVDGSVLNAALFALLSLDANSASSDEDTNAKLALAIGSTRYQIPQA